MSDIGLASAEARVECRALTGGVSSDIFRVDVDSARYCAKFALAKLRVEQDWFAPTHRNQAEFEWLEFAQEIIPGSVPRLFGRSERYSGFVMEFCDGDGVRNLKQDLLAGRISLDIAARIGVLMAQLHAASAKRLRDTGQFSNQSDFAALRVEPYLEALTDKYPALCGDIETLKPWYAKASIALVHGDVSPKNILVRDDQPIVLDAECATMGDPAFDVAFCLNHYILKSIHKPDCASDLIAAARRLGDRYLALVDWEGATGLEKRICELLPLLMLARVDGKSPVEYLDEAAKDSVRASAMAIRGSQPTQLQTLFATLLRGHNGSY